MNRTMSCRAFQLIGMALLLLGLISSACDRKPRLVPASRDSLAVPDSLSILTRLASDQWNLRQHNEASSISARVLRIRLRNWPGREWVERSRVFLDSLGIAAEVVGQGPVMAINLFSRAEAQEATWPFLFWREADDVRVQVIEGREYQLLDASARGFIGEVAQDSSQVAVLWSRKSAYGHQPLLLVWNRATGGRWDLMQTLGPDSLGGVGTGAFLDSSLVVRTWGPTPYFEENCSSCPHVIHQRTFRWGARGFECTQDRAQPTPYASFTEFITALVTGDHDAAMRLVADPSLVEFARRLEWHDPALGRWRAAPGSSANATELVFHRGRKDAFHVAFQSRGSQWVLSGFEPIARSVE